MRKAIALFQEKDTRDELGLGTIRDTFADDLFPGTSTIQTRLRYVLFIPWIYRELQAKRSKKAVAARARDREVELISPLTKNEDDRGTIGRRSKVDLQRLPSSVYWAALQRWDICLFDGSREQYHRAFHKLEQRRKANVIPDDEGIESSVRPVWHPKLPPVPENWPDEVDFQLTLEEADFLRGRLAQTCNGSLLDWLAQNDSVGDGDWMWAIPELARLPADLRERVELARRFSLVMHGPALLYNLMLASRYKDAERRAEWEEKYRAELHAWSSGKERSDLQTFDCAELWRFVDKREARVPLRTRTFVERWVSMLRETDPAAVADHAPARALVEERERSLKKARSRFANQRALDAWKGSSGEARLPFRWGVVKSHLRDLQEVKDR